MNAAAYIGRVGGLAVALGIGAVLAGGIGVASADDSASATSSSNSADGSTTSSGSVSSTSSAGPKRTVESPRPSTKHETKGATEDSATAAAEPPSGEEATKTAEAKPVKPAKKSTVVAVAVKSGSTATASVAAVASDPAKSVAAKSAAGTSADGVAGALATAAAVGSATTTPTAKAATATVAATTTTATTAKTTDPIAAFFAKMRWMFNNASPTISFDPSESVRNDDGSFTGKVHVNDTDGDKLTVTVKDILNGGTVAVGPDGNFVYWRGAGFDQAGDTDRFTVTVSDAGNGVKFHGLLGLFKPGYGDTASTRVTIDDSNTAAVAYGWGTTKKSTNFSSLSTLLKEGWGVYSGAGNGGYGTRSPDALSFADNIMTISGDPDGNSGGLGWGTGQTYGMWEVRAKVPEGAAGYSAVALLWPDAENWPYGGEINFLEIKNDATRSVNTAALHYSILNKFDTFTQAVDATEWHNYAVSWTPQAVTFYIDAVPYWTVTDTTKFPPGAMHLALQLDVHNANIAGGAQMQVAWARQYAYTSA